MTTMPRKQPVPVLIQHALLRLGERVKVACMARQLTQAELFSLQTDPEIAAYARSELAGVKD